MTNLSKTLQLTNFFLLLLLMLSAGAAWGQSGRIPAISFGMQCGSQNGCPASLPNGPGVPALLRLWDSEVAWNALNPNCSTPPCTNWNFTNLDAYLDAIAADSSIQAAIYTFGWVPCWDVVGGVTGAECNGPLPGSSSYPPKDLNANGSATFNAFVNALTTRCTTNHNCVGNCPPTQPCNKANIIKYYEMWNEANDPFYWETNPLSTQETTLYEMAVPAASIIRQNVSGAQILTPSVNTCGGTGCTPYQTWQTKWLSLEDSNTRISDIYNFHVYMNVNTPEDQYQNVVIKMLAARNADLKWASTLWWNDETNFIPNNYTCDTKYLVPDCTGQIARWQLLHASNSGPSLSTNVSWYKWKSTMAEQSSYGLAYQYIKQYMVGGSFSSPCANNSGTWTCPFNENPPNGRHALFIWAPAGNTTYNATGWSDYRDLSGGTTTIPPNNPNITIGVEPLMLEK